jgi:hypothetical protein
MKTSNLVRVVWTMFLLVSAVSAFAQPPDTLWTRLYGGEDYDEVFCVRQTSDGGFILAGYTVSFGAGNSDCYIIRTDSLGDTLWTRTYGGTNAEVAYSIEQTSDEGYIVVGSTSSYGAGASDVYIVRLNASGDTLWTRVYGGINTDRAQSVQQTTDGGYIVGGSTASLGAGNYDFYLLKTDALGDTVWTRTYGGTMPDMGESVQQTTDGGYIITGSTESFGAGIVDMYLVKTDGSGNLVWSRTYGGDRADGAYEVQQTTDGGYILAGFTLSFGAGSSDFYVVKTDASGDTVWTSTYGGTSDDGANAIQQTADGGFIVAGWTWSSGSRNLYLEGIKISLFGVMFWAYLHEGNVEGGAYSVRQTRDRGYVMAGTAYPQGSQTGDAMLVRLEAEQTATELMEVGLPGEYTLHQNWPNPFNPVTRISYDLPRASRVSLRVFDLTGREVAAIAGGMQAAGTHTILFDGSHLASGVYFVRLEAEDFASTRKMVVLK